MSCVWFSIIYPEGSTTYMYGRRKSYSSLHLLSFKTVTPDMALVYYLFSTGQLARPGEGPHTYHLPLIIGDEVHLVDQAEDLGVGRVLQDGLQARLVVVHVLLHLATLYVEDVDQNLDVSEDVVALAREVVLHERFLAVRRERVVVGLEGGLDCLEDAIMNIRMAASYNGSCGGWVK